uniref:Uncharacterized protein n=1 Tax=viral metagenome TaxID=1070528 RepID=A0A6C0EP33_9ZZZZ
MILSFLQKLRAFPELLEQEYPEMTRFLHRQGNLTLKRGSGNRPQDQEACFAVEAEKHGFKFLAKGTTHSSDGCYYKYQLNGSQRCKDFALIEVVDGISTEVKFDLKSAKGNSFYFNDGWFQSNVIYIVSYIRKKQNRIYIGYGEESYLECDNVAWNEIRSKIKEMNKYKKNTTFLKIYNRLGNQYSCDQFTDQFSKERFESIEKRLA